MLRLGVLEPEEFLSAPPKGFWPYLRYRLSRGRVSLRLLGSARDGALFERLMAHVQLSNGVYRTTFERRFRGLDPAVNRVLASHFSSADNLVVEDWAASACLTSCEWAESLFPLFPRLQFTASDLALFLIEIADMASGEVFAAEQDGRLLQYVRPPFAIRMEPPESWTTPLNRLLFERARRRWARAARLWPLPDSWMDLRSVQPLERDGYALRKLPLVHPRVLALAEIDPRFSIRQHSVFEQAKTPCHVIRTMNILNKAYFPAGQLGQAARGVLASLHPGGIWIVGRTVRDGPPVHEVSMFRKQSAGGWEVVERIGAGSEIEPIVLRPHQQYT